MSDMDDFPEGDDHSSAADAPGTIPSDDAPERGAAKQGGFDSSVVSDAPTVRTNRPAARAASARKAFAEAVLANKDKPTPVTAADEFDPEAPAVVAKPAIAALADVAAAKAKAADVPAPAAKPVAPPAPSLDPEVRQLRETLKREREQLAADRAELEKSKPAAAAPAVAPDSDSLERYIDNAPTWLRDKLEGMRADKMSDEEFKSEVADLITMLSGDVLGVPLPETVRIKLEAAQAKKMVRTHKTIQTRKEAAAAEKAKADEIAASTKAETERVEQEWGKAATVLSQQFAGAESTAAKTYQWLAAEDDPGAAIVDVIRVYLNKDGTKLSWQEAAKLADDYLAEDNKKHFAKRQSLFGGSAAPAPKPAAPAVKPIEPPAAKPAVVLTPSGNQRWNNDKHRENTRAAFRAQLAKPE